jgi:uncharacterized protein YabE (DUF348 family)
LRSTAAALPLGVCAYPRTEQFKGKDAILTEPDETSEGLEPPPRALPDRAPKHRRVWLIVAAAALTVLVVVGGTLLALTKTVTITVDGQSRSVTTLAGSVSGALKAAELTVAEHDTVAPAVSESIADGSTIVINRGRLLSLTIDGQPVALWTTTQTVADALDEMGRDPSDYQLSADRSRKIPLDGLAVTADTLHNISVDDRGSIRTVPAVTMTVADFLDAQGIELGPKDRVSPDPGSMMSADSKVVVITLPTVTVTDGTAAATEIVSEAATVADLLAGSAITLGAQDVVSVPLDTPLADGLQVSITRVSSTQVSETVVIDQPADQTVNDAKLAAGTTKVTQTGQPGQQVVVYDVVLTNGVESSRTELSRTDTVQALPTVTHVGTKVAPPVVATPPATPVTPTVPTSTATIPPPVTGNTEYVGGKVYFHDFEYGVNWDGLAKCESGNNPRAVNPSGKYTGMFQFDDRTWQGVGGSGRAYDAPAEEQLMRAKQLYLSRGLQPWACAWAA